jgi:hypothetical protein
MMKVLFFFSAFCLSALNAQAETISIPAFSVKGFSSDSNNKMIQVIPVKGRPTGVVGMGGFKTSDVISWGETSSVSNGETTVKAISFNQDDFSPRIFNYLLVIVTNPISRPYILKNFDGSFPTFPGPVDFANVDPSQSQFQQLLYVSWGYFQTVMKASAGRPLVLEVAQDFGR